MESDHEDIRFIAGDRSADTMLEKVTIMNGSNQIMQFYDDKEYAGRINTIMESIDVKDELGETILWGHIITTGYFRKKTNELWLITNYRVMCASYKTGEVIQLPLKYIDVVVMNASNNYSSEGVGAFAAVPASITSGMGFLRRSGTSRRIGDLVFLMNGQIFLRFFNVIDPLGAKQMIYKVKRQMYGNGK